MDTQHVTQALADYAVNYTPSPEEYAKYLPYFKASVFDWLATVSAGAQEECVEIVSRMIAFRGSSGKSASLLTGSRVFASDAALLNALGGHAIDYDDVHETDGLHLNSPILSAAFAAAEQTEASVSQVFEGVLAGMDVTAAVCKLLTRGHTRRNWHTTATLSVYGAAAAAGRLLGLTPVQMRCAFGIAASCSAGLLANLGTMTKPLQVAYASQRGVEAAFLARSGFTADKDIFDGAYPAMVSDELSPESALAFLQEGGAIARLAYKRFPCGVPTHANIMNMLKLRQAHSIAPEQIESVDVTVSPFTMASGCGPLMSKPELEYGSQGKFSVPFVVASAAKFGSVNTGTFTDENAHDPAIQALMRRVRVTVDEKLTSTDAGMLLTLKDGSSFFSLTKNVRTGETLQDKGAIAREKFRTEAGRLWRGEAPAAIEAFVEMMPLEESVQSFTDLLIP